MSLTTVIINKENVNIEEGDFSSLIDKNILIKSDIILYNFINYKIQDYSNIRSILEKTLNKYLVNENKLFTIIGYQIYNIKITNNTLLQVFTKRNETKLNYLNNLHKMGRDGKSFITRNVLENDNGKIYIIFCKLINKNQILNNMINEIKLNENDIIVINSNDFFNNDNIKSSANNDNIKNIFRTRYISNEDFLSLDLIRKFYIKRFILNDDSFDEKIIKKGKFYINVIHPGDDCININEDEYDIFPDDKLCQ